MSIKRTYHNLLRFFAICSICLSLTLPANVTLAQSEVAEHTVDPRLIEIVEIVKGRTIEHSGSVATASDKLTVDEINLELIDQMQTGFYSRDPDKIIEAVENFQRSNLNDPNFSLESIPELYLAYAQLITQGATYSDIQASLANFTNDGNWFEKYIALSVIAHSHATAQEKQAALQKAQSALSIIPTKPNLENVAYVDYAKERITSLIAHLHNLQGNSELALGASLDYLKLTEDEPDLKTEVDLINNLIYSYSLARNTDAQLYLSQQLLMIEKTQSSSVAGLSEMRISSVMNSSGRFEDGLDYAKRSIEKASNPTVMQISRVNKATSLAGLGRLEEARKIARLAGVNLDRTHMLTSETRESKLHLAFILAQAEDLQYATQLYNRQLDVKAQKFYANNSRDTTAMLAQLENSHERQAEREAAAARESELQALTINRQRNLNRALTGLSIFMAWALFAGFLFIRFRGRVLRKLEIKTREAASAEKLKSEFLGMISHELRTPLNGIIGLSDYLANHHTDDDIREKTSIILRSGNELLSVVESLTDMARIDAGELMLVLDDADLGESLTSIPGQWVEAARAKGLTFTSFIDPAIARHHVDKDRIRQCINILLANAISFTETGRVHLHITASKSEPLALTAIVADTGQGMSDLVQSRLFTPFMQADTSRKRSHMGTGLSLAIAYALAEMMDGSLTVVSREGRGSEFTFNVPLMPAINAASIDNLPRTDIKKSEIGPLKIIGPKPISSAVPAPAPEIEKPRLTDPILQGKDALQENPKGGYIDLMQPRSIQKPGLHSAKPSAEASAETQFQSPEPPLRILIVDDINSNRDILRLLLEKKGHICREAADGFAALASLDRHIFDIVIMDIHMAPMDGIEATRRIRASGQRYENLPVIALTADNAANINAEMMEAGANLFLTKPVKQAELFQSLDILRQSERLPILSRIA